MKYIELFAGCGGLSLGLESLGYELLFANELSPMASETFAFNLLNEDLSAIEDRPQKVKWITSNYDVSELPQRLRENPQTFPVYPEGHSDLPDNLDDLRNCLLVGSIIELNAFLRKNPQISDEIRRQNVDLVSGGPPCQSFSMAGLRQVDNQRNSLPMDFAEFVSITEPKIALLENVSGILRAFKLGDSKYFAWFEVARAFASKGYYPICLHVNAKYAGAAQNRPRFILIAIREDVFSTISEKATSNQLIKLLRESQAFMEKERNGEKTIVFSDLNYHDIEKDAELFSDDHFSSLFSLKTESDFFSVEDAIDDLKGYGDVRSDYASTLKKFFPHPSQCPKSKPTSNHEHRENSVRVRMRFMLYQHLSDLKNGSNAGIEKDVIKYLQDPKCHQLSDSSVEFLLSKHFLLSDGESRIQFSDQGTLTEYLTSLATKKQTQRALLRSNPAPAALSIPDDACHYDKNLQRTLTVREMARFQSFPDWFEFRSKVTTGGKMRRFEVPQYTQVGNAVPPVLGRALGETIKSILDLDQ